MASQVSPNLATFDRELPFLDVDVQQPRVMEHVGVGVLSFPSGP